MLTLPEIDKVLVRYGRGEMDAYAVAASLGVVMPVPIPAELLPGGDAYRNYAVPVPPDSYLNPGAPVIPEAYRTA
jgi:hypothetical protein